MAAVSNARTPLPRAPPGEFNHARCDCNLLNNRVLDPARTMARAHLNARAATEISPDRATFIPNIRGLRVWKACDRRERPGRTARRTAWRAGLAEDRTRHRLPVRRCRRPLRRQRAHLKQPVFLRSGSAAVHAVLDSGEGQIDSRYRRPPVTPGQSDGGRARYRCRPAPSARARRRHSATCSSAIARAPVRAPT